MGVPLIFSARTKTDRPLASWPVTTVRTLISRLLVLRGPLGVVDLKAGALIHVRTDAIWSSTGSTSRTPRCCVRCCARPRRGRAHPEKPTRGQTQPRPDHAAGAR